MKKSQSIFLLSGLVPLVAAPIAIVASCSSETKTESQVEAERLNGLIQSSKIKILSGKETLNDALLAEIKATPDKLLSDYLDKNELALKEDKFTYNIIDLADAQPKQDNPTPTQPKSLSFKFRVVNKTNDKETYDSILASVAYQYQPGVTVENPALAQAVTTIETAHTNKSFKLKDDKTTMSQADVDKLTANPGLLLTTEFSDGFPSLDQGLTPSITKNNFSIIDKKQAQGTAKTIQFKVTVTDAQKVEKETKQLTFDFTLQAAASVTANDVKDEIEKLETAKTFKLKAGKETLTQAEVTALPGKSATFISEYTQGLTLKDGFNYVVEGLKVENSKFKQGQQPQPTTKFVKFQIKVTNKTNNSETATTREFSWQITETTN